MRECCFVSAAEGEDDWLLLLVAERVQGERGKWRRKVVESGDLRKRDSVRRGCRIRREEFAIVAMVDNSEPRRLPLSLPAKIERRVCLLFPFFRFSNF